MGWLSGWSWAKEISLTGQAGAGTLYQVDLDIGDSAGGDFHCEGHCTNFPQDIEVTDNDGTTLLDFSIEDITADPIKLWVEVADDLGSNQKVWVYYGKSGATTNSDIADTFILGDDFNVASPWTEVDPNSHIVQDRTTDKRLEVTGLSRNEDAYLYASRTTDSIVVYSKAKVTSANAGQVLGIVGISDTLDDMANWQNGANAYFYYTPHRIDIAGYASGSRTTQAIAVSVNTDYWIKLVLDGTTATLYVYSDATMQTLVDNKSVTIGDVSYSYVYSAMSYNSGTVVGGDFLADDIRVRKYNSPEPAFSSAGAEQSAPVVGAIMKQFQKANIGADLYNGAIIA